jgi:uncharacterized protein (DUF169 family)
MSEFKVLFERFLEVYKYEDENGTYTVRIPCCGLKFSKKGERDLLDVFTQSPRWLEFSARTLASCGYSYKSAKGGWTLRATKQTIGCPAGATSLGLVASDSTDSFAGGCYVEPMQQPASPADFAAGYVYAPRQSGHPEFALFGDSDCGRYETLEAARTALASMPVIPSVMQAVYYYHPILSEVEVEPDLVHLYCTPLQAMRLVQGYCYTTGNRFNMSCIGIRGVSCDMTAWPYVNDEMNATFLCLGARGISGWEEQYVGFGLPFSKFRELVVGMEKSKSGYPYKIFPKSSETRDFVALRTS